MDYHPIILALQEERQRIDKAIEVMKQLASGGSVALPPRAEPITRATRRRDRIAQQQQGQQSDGRRRAASDATRQKMRDTWAKRKRDKAAAADVSQVAAPPKPEPEDGGTVQ